MAVRDFTANQIRTAKVIMTGSSPSGGIVHKKLELSVYSESVAPNELGGNPAAPAYTDIGNDVSIFISGSQTSKDGSNGGAVLLQGDTYISGSLVVKDAGRNFGGSISGSIHHTADGVSYLVAAAGIQITSASNGQLTIKSTITNDVLEGLHYYDEYNGTPALDPLAAGTHSVAIGDGPLASGTNSIAFGNKVTGSGEHDAVVGGFGNATKPTQLTSNTKNAIFGGKNNLISGSSASVIVGGGDNHISGTTNLASGGSDFSGIFGGAYNKVSGSYSNVMGGIFNKTEQNYSTVIGQSLTSSNTGEVVIGFGSTYAGGGLKRTIISGSNFIVAASNIAVFNEDGKTADFRVEGSSIISGAPVKKQGAILVDGSTNQVVIQGGGVAATKSYGLNAATTALPSDISTYISGACGTTGRLPATSGVTVIAGDLVVSGTIFQKPCFVPEGTTTTDLQELIVLSDPDHRNATTRVVDGVGFNSRNIEVITVRRFGEATTFVVEGDQVVKGELRGSSPLKIGASGSNDALIVSGNVEIVAASGSNVGANLSISGSMTVTGSMTVSGSNTFTVVGPSIFDGSVKTSDKLIELANGTTGTPSGDAGFIIERGSSDNAAFIWDESRDEFALGTTTATGASTGDLTFTKANLSVERLGAGTEQAQAEVHAKRDQSSGGVYSTTATVISEDDARPAIQLVGSANNIGLIQFGDNAAAASGQIYYDHSTDKIRFDAGSNTDRLTISSTGEVVVAGDLVVNGTTTTVNSSTLIVDDKNIELGSVVAISSVSATSNLTTGNATVNVASTTGMIIGQTVVKASGTGAFNTANSGTRTITAINSATQITLDANHSSAGSMVFNVAAASDTTADGGGITIKGTTDKTFQWQNDTNSFEVNKNLSPSASGGSDLGTTTNEWGDIYIADEKSLKIGTGQEHFIKDAAPGLQLGSSEIIKIGADANTSNIEIGNISQAKTITVGHDTSTKVDVNAATVELDAGTAITIDSAGTAAAAVGITSAGGLDFTSTGAHPIDIESTNAAGNIILKTAHTAGVAFHIDADADSASEVQIDAGILDIDVTGAATLDATSMTTTAATQSIAASTSLTVTSPAVIIDSATDGKPVVTIKTTNTTAASSGELQFLKDAADTEDGEILGKITFFGEDEGNNSTQFAGIVASISESDETDEAGTLELQVAESDGTNTAMTTGLKLEGEHATDGQVDVTIAAGAASTTTIAGDLTVTTDLAVDGVSNLDNVDIDGTFTMDGTTFDVNASGAVTIDGTTISIDGTDDVNLTVTSSTAGEDLTIAQVGANDSSIIITAAGTGTDAIKIDATAGDMLIAPNLINGKTLKIGPTSATEMVFTPHGTAANEKISLTNTSGNADDAIKIESTAGGVTIKSNTAKVILSGSSADDSVHVQSSMLVGGKLVVNGGGIPTVILGDTINTNDATIESATVANNVAGRKFIIDAGNATAGGNNNLGGGDLFLNAGRGKGSASGGDIIFQSALAAGSGNTVNPYQETFRIKESKRVLILSGVNGSPNSINESLYADTNFFVSGSIGSRGTATLGTAVFGGDVVISGSLNGGSPLTIGTDLEIAGGTLEFSKAGENAILVPDNQADALVIKEGSNLYAKFATTGGSELVTFFKDVLIQDDKKLLFGTDSDAYIEYDEDGSNSLVAHVPAAGFTILGIPTGDNSPVRLNLLSSEAALVADEVVGQIDFQAIGESGTDAQEICASIQAIAEAEFDSANNQTKLAFFTAKSEDATSVAAKLEINHGGAVTMNAGTTTAGGNGFDGGEDGAPTADVQEINNEVVTTFKINIDNMVSTAGSGARIIGDSSGAANAYFARLNSGVNGLIYKAEMICVEAPTTGEPDLDLYAKSDLQPEGGGVGGDFAKLIDADGDWIVSKYKEQIGPFPGSTDPAYTNGLHNYYLYLANGNGGTSDAGTYGAGKWLVRLYGVKTFGT